MEFPYWYIEHPIVVPPQHVRLGCRIAQSQVFHWNKTQIYLRLIIRYWGGQRCTRFHIVEMFLQQVELSFLHDWFFVSDDWHWLKWSPQKMRVDSRWSISIWGQNVSHQFITIIYLCNQLYDCMQGVLLFAETVTNQFWGVISLWQRYQISLESQLFWRIIDQRRYDDSLFYNMCYLYSKCVLLPPKMDQAKFAQFR